MNSYQDRIDTFLYNGHEVDCLREQVQEHYSKIYLTTALSIFGLVLVGHLNWIVSTDIQKDMLILWMVFICVLTTIRLTLVSNYRKHQANIDDHDVLLDPIPWAKMEVFCCGYFGAVVGGLFFIMYNGSLLDSFASAQAATIVIAITTAVSGFLAIYLPCYLAFIWGCALPVAVKLLLYADLSGIFGLIAFGGFHAVLYSFISTLNRKLSEPIELRLQSMKLIENLARRYDAIDTQNKELLCTLSQTTSSFKSNYIRLFKMLHASSNSENIDPRFNLELIAIENSSLMGSYISDIENGLREINVEAFTLTDAMKRLPIKLKETAERLTINYEYEDASIQSDPTLFDLFLRSTISNMLTIRGIKTISFNRPSKNNNEIQILAKPTTPDNDVEDNAESLNDDIELLKLLCKKASISLEVITSSENGLGYSINHPQ